MEAINFGMMIQQNNYNRKSGVYQLYNYEENFLLIFSFTYPILQSLHPEIETKNGLSIVKLTVLKNNEPVYG